MEDKQHNGDRQHNGQKKKNKMTENDLQKTTES